MASQFLEQSWRQKLNSARDAYVEHGGSLMRRVGAACGNAVNRLRQTLTVPDRAGEGPVAEDITEVGTLELLGEALRLTKQRVSAGEVIIRKEVITETQLIEVPVRREELIIERRDASGNSERLTELNGRELRIVLGEEKTAVETKPVVREVVRVSRRQVWEKRAVSELVRHEELRRDDVRRPDRAANDMESAA
ncbi:MAG TPA: YsnF/AvaK domain-containing protein [Terriglobales bacterium]|nr:YsnF/AvaK domain-containing protein [Terriglobales bacterium]